MLLGHDHLLSGAGDRVDHQLGLEVSGHLLVHLVDDHEDLRVFESFQGQFTHLLGPDRDRVFRH